MNSYLRKRWFVWRILYVLFIEKWFFMFRNLFILVGKVVMMFLIACLICDVLLSNVLKSKLKSVFMIFIVRKEYVFVSFKVSAFFFKFCINFLFSVLLLVAKFWVSILLFFFNILFWWYNKGWMEIMFGFFILILYWLREVESDDWFFTLLSYVFLISLSDVDIFFMFGLFEVFFF